ncbi:MAG: hypothetical protein AAF226_18795, partial [Verrucomicrobiota bacterium]
IETLISAFGDAEYRYLFLEPILLFGIALGLVLFVVSMVIGGGKMRITALAILALSGLTMSPYLSARIDAKPRIQKVYQIKSPARGEAFAANTSKWIQARWWYFALAIMAAVTFLAGMSKGKLGLVASLVMIGLALMTIKNSAWLHYRDSLAYHPNLGDRSKSSRLKAGPTSNTNSRIPAMGKSRSTSSAGSAEGSQHKKRAIEPLYR